MHGAPVQAHSEYHHILRASASVVALNRSASADIGHWGRLTGQFSAQAPLIHSAWIHSSTRSCILTGTEMCLASKCCKSALVTTSEFMRFAHGSDAGNGSTALNPL